MLYPTYTEYIDQINTALDTYKHLQVVRKADGEPFYYTGNYSIVFKMQEAATQKYFAVKCFTRGHAQLIAQYQQISKCLGAITSPHLLSFEFLEKELFIDSKQTTDNEFACVVMEWAEGTPLMPALREACSKADIITLKKIYQAFITLSQWLLAQPFAHGDLKPDNLIWNGTTETLQLVDYDGCYIPNSRINQAMEQGSSGYSHPQRASQGFDKHIDDFSILVMVLSLKALYIQPSLFAQFNNDTDILLTQSDYANWNNSKVNIELQALATQDATMPILLGLLHSTILQKEAKVDLLDQILEKLKGEKQDMTIGEWWTDLDALVQENTTLFLNGDYEPLWRGDIINCLISVHEISNVTCRGDLENLKHLKYLTSLTSLEIYNCKNLSDISALQYLTSLTNLEIYGCENLSDISALQYLTSLTDLEIYGCENLSNISALRYLTSLTSLTIDRCENISDISALQYLTSLTSLRIYNCPNISDISALQYLTSLTRLRIWSFDNISDISVLQDLTSLTSLSIYNCPNISDISALQDLDKIRTIQLLSNENLPNICSIAALKDYISGSKNYLL
jgi:serine/threonine protein kinase